MNPIRVTLIVARARNGVIGLRNALPWRIPEEMQHFRRSTSGHALIVGRMTFESIGRALPGRRMIVVTRDPHWSAPGCERAGSVPEAIMLAASAAPDQPEIDATEAFIGGGVQIYEAAMPLADRILMTEVALEPEGDAFMPPPNPAQWRECSRQTHSTASGIDFDIVDYRRLSADLPEPEPGSGGQRTA